MFLSQDFYNILLTFSFSLLSNVYENLKIFISTDMQPNRLNYSAFICF